MSKENIKQFEQIPGYIPDVKDDKNLLTYHKMSDSGRNLGSSKSLKPPELHPESAKLPCADSVYKHQQCRTPIKSANKQISDKEKSIIIKQNDFDLSMNKEKNNDDNISVQTISLTQKDDKKNSIYDNGLLENQLCDESGAKNNSKTENYSSEKNDSDRKQKNSDRSTKEVHVSISESPHHTSRMKEFSDVHINSKKNNAGKGGTRKKTNTKQKKSRNMKKEENDSSGSESDSDDDTNGKS